MEYLNRLCHSIILAKFVNTEEKIVIVLVIDNYFLELAYTFLYIKSCEDIYLI
jgi:hypothetical protein